MKKPGAVVAERSDKLQWIQIYGKCAFFSGYWEKTWVVDWTAQDCWEYLWTVKEGISEQLKSLRSSKIYIYFFYMFLLSSNYELLNGNKHNSCFSAQVSFLMKCSGCKGIQKYSMNEWIFFKSPNFNKGLPPKTMLIFISHLLQIFVRERVVSGIAKFNSFVVLERGFHW